MADVRACSVGDDNVDRGTLHHYTLHMECRLHGLSVSVQALSSMLFKLKVS